MVIWYVIGYFVIGIIVDIILTVDEKLHLDPIHDETAGLMGSFIVIIAWPLCLITLLGIQFLKAIDRLSEWLAKQIKERSKHER